MAVHREHRARTLGLLGTGLVTLMQNQLWQGAMKAAQEHGARLVYYPTISLSSSPPFSPHTKVLFDFVDGQYLDGLLIWYAGVAEGIGLDQAKSFFDRYENLPLLTVGGPLAHHPDLSVDNYQGVRAAIEHLIKVHGRHHFAMIRGPVGHPDADERYRAYVETLHDYGLPIEPDRIVETLFEFTATAEITRTAVTRWLQDSAKPLDAVVASSDYMALAAVKAVEAYERRVPDDIAVVGFDDVNDSRANIPSITTVRQPFYDLGYEAIEMLLAQMDGHSLPARSLRPSQLVVRESCGCFTNAPSLADSRAERHSGRARSMLGMPSRLFSDELNIPLDVAFPQEQVKNLANCLQSDLSLETSHLFLSTLRRYLIEAVGPHFDAIGWQSALSAIRQHVLSVADGKMALLAEGLFSEARVLVTEVHQRAYIRQQLEAGQQIEDLRRTSEALIASFGRQLLLDTIYRQLPALGFPGAYLSLYEDPNCPETWSYLILAYHDHQRLDLPPEGLRFPTGQLVPASLPSAGQPIPLVVEPLYFGGQQLGMLVLEVGPTQGVIYENLRAQISGALQGSQLLQQVQNHAAQLEQRVSARTEELTRAVNQLQMEVTERRQTQEALAHERNLLRTLVDSMPDIIFAKDTEGRFTLKNKTDAHFMGVSSPAELIGKTDFDYYPRDVAERFRLDDQRVLQSGEPLINREELVVDSEGNERWLLTSKVPLRDNQSGVIGLLGVGRDITERKKAEKALRQSEEHAREFQEKLKALQEVSFELVFTESIDQLCTRAIELGHHSLGFDRIGLLLFEDSEHTKVSRFGIESTGELRVQHEMRYIMEEDHVLASGLLMSRESVFVSEDTELSDFEDVVGRGWNVVTGLWDGSSSIGWLAADNYFEKRPLIPYQVELLNLYGLTIGHLVTRKRAEIEIRRLNDELEQRVAERTAQLEASNEALESFAYVVSHDLKAPLRGISQLVSWLGLDYSDAFDNDGRKMLDLLTKRTKRMHDLIEGILQYSRIGRVREQKLRIDLNQLLRDVIDGLAPPPHIQVSVESRLPTVRGDRTRLEQVFQNLLGNAIKFMDKAEGRVMVHCQPDGPRWRFSVSDNGPGIDPKYHGKIFQIFQTLNVHQKDEGTGIGLALVKRIVEQWGGTIWLESTAGQGSTFFFTIPQE